MVRALVYDESTAEGNARAHFFKRRLAGLQQQLVDRANRNKLSDFLGQLTKYILENRRGELRSLLGGDRVVGSAGGGEERLDQNDPENLARRWEGVAARVRLRVEEAVYMPLRRKVLHIVRRQSSDANIGVGEQGGQSACA